MVQQQHLEIVPDGVADEDLALDEVRNLLLHDLERLGVAFGQILGANPTDPGAEVCDTLLSLDCTHQQAQDATRHDRSPRRGKKGRQEEARRV